MTKFEFWIPTPGNGVPAGAEWLHEVKYDGCRFRIERDGKSVRSITRGGYDWTKRFPWIAEAALKNRRSHSLSTAKRWFFASMASPISTRFAPASTIRKSSFAPFDVLAMDGKDLRDLPLSMRKGNLVRLLRGRPDRMFINPFEVGGFGADLFRAACDMGLEGLVSKRRDWV
jgi:bifunctional non-homologous end joining protein LigD